MSSLHHGLCYVLKLSKLESLMVAWKVLLMSGCVILVMIKGNLQRKVIDFQGILKDRTPLMS